MRPAFFLLLYGVFFCATVTAQNGSRPYFNDPARRYINNREADSLIKKVARDVFTAGGQEDQFDVVYPSIKNNLTRLVVQYSSPELNRMPKAPAKSAAFDTLKGNCFLALARETQNQLYNNIAFRKYIGLNASDRITRFHTNITVLPNDKLRVEEIITIYNGNGAGIHTPADYVKEEGGMNNEIQRGIRRAFPIVYTDKYKLLHRTGFKLISVKRKDIGEEDWFLKNYRNGVQLYLGRKDRFLPIGYFTYTITYETERQIAYHKDYDELAWNVTGTDWSFRIESASCTITLPDSARVISGACYTGKYGSTDKNCALQYTQTGNTIMAQTTRFLRPGENLTLAVSWPKGFVKASESRLQFWWRMFKSNQAVFLLPLLALLFGMYNYLAWRRVGRDPEPGTIIPEYYPPKGLSPAAMGYIYHQGFGSHLIAATITDWAVKKYITINVEQKGFLFKRNVYKISDGSGKMASKEYDDYFSDSDELEDTTIQKGKYNKALGDFKRTLQEDLDKKYKAGGKRNFFKPMFVLNNWYMAPGNVLTTLGTAYILFGVFTRPGYSNPWHGLYLLGGFILCIVVQNIFYRLIKAYTPEGRQVMDKIEGFRLFLKTADEDRINFVNPPKKDLALYETYLPFAIALDCEVEWGKQFEDILRTATTDPDTGSISHSSFSDSNFSSSFSSSFTSSLSGAISSASTPPSSSSGGSSFGGGFSGGGGGGGGGGGW